jgi:CRISPR-associated endoribonuclease Cas6
MIKNKNLELKIIKKTITQTSYKDLIDKYFSNLDETKARYKKITFLTPTTYKSSGDYQNMPNLSSLFINIYNKWNSFCPEFPLEDDNVIKILLDNSKIQSYQLKSVSFDMEGIKINSFIGNMSIKFNCAKEIAVIGHILLDFATFAGIGAKTTLSMGGMKID